MEAPAKRVHRGPVLYAITAFLAAAESFYLITHVPEATGTNGRWTIGETESLRVIGPSRGQLLTMKFSGKGLASVSAGEGSRIVEPVPAVLDLLKKEIDPQFKEDLAGKPLKIRVDSPEEDSTAVVSIAVERSDSAEPAVEIQPDAGDDETGMRLQASRAPMTVTVDWSSPPSPAQQQGPLLVGEQGRTLPVGRAVISVPEGQTVYIGGPTNKVAFEIGSHRDRLSRGGLDLQSLQIAGVGQGPVTSRACGAAKGGQLRWPRLFGGVFSLKSCRQALHMQGLKLAGETSFALSGPGFVMKEAKVHYWQLLPNLMSNLVMQFALTGLVGGLIGWVAFILGLKRASSGPTDAARRNAGPGRGQTRVRRS